MKYKFESPENIAKFIKTSPKSTPVKAYINGDLKKADFNNIEWYGNENFYILFGEYAIIKAFIKKYKSQIKFYRFENDRRNSTIPLLNFLEEDIRIEPGAIIRSNVKIEKYSEGMYNFKVHNIIEYNKEENVPDKSENEVKAKKQEIDENMDFETRHKKLDKYEIYKRQKEEKEKRKSQEFATKKIENNIEESQSEAVTKSQILNF